MRAYVIESQSSPKSVVLLQKEMELRELDRKFDVKQDQIVDRAKKLDEKKFNFKIVQKEMVEKVKKEMQSIVAEADKRRKEE